MEAASDVCVEEDLEGDDGNCRLGRGNNRRILDEKWGALFRAAALRSFGVDVVVGLFFKPAVPAEDRLACSPGPTAAELVVEEDIGPPVLLLLLVANKGFVRVASIDVNDRPELMVINSDRILPALPCRLPDELARVAVLGNRVATSFL